jgi:hypothetical protein
MQRHLTVRQKNTSTAHHTERTTVSPADRRHSIRHSPVPQTQHRQDNARQQTGQRRQKQRRIPNRITHKSSPILVFIYIYMKPYISFFKYTKLS